MINKSEVKLQNRRRYLHYMKSSENSRIHRELPQINRSTTQGGNGQETLHRCLLNNKSPKARHEKLLNIITNQEIAH